MVSIASLFAVCRPTVVDLSSLTLWVDARSIETDISLSTIVEIECIIFCRRCCFVVYVKVQNRSSFVPRAVEIEAS